MSLPDNEQVPPADQLLLAEYYFNLSRIVSRRPMSTDQVITVYGSLSSAEDVKDLIEDIQLEEISAQRRGIELPPCPNHLRKYLQ
jgi:hypothetical protein